uniref:G_PROTEIN_RECEP_F1_2 domain-containing protein n=1 Tax=Angiostrongylus cantonensis TaxID=6313 RepID=A0A0K0DMQ1_ANGCA
MSKGSEPNISSNVLTFEQWMTLYNETIEFERKIGIIIPFIFALIIVIGVVGNFLVVVVALSRSMRNSTNTLIIGKFPYIWLAISDLMFLLLCVPFTAVDYALSVSIFPEWTCSMINFFQHSSAYCSVWTLMLMALDRYLAVVYPVDSLTLRSPKNAVIALAVVFAVTAATQVPIGLMHGIHAYDFFTEVRSTCAIVSIATSTATLTYRDAPLLVPCSSIFDSSRYDDYDAPHHKKKRLARMLDSNQCGCEEADAADTLASIKICNNLF